ncbi:SMP-30/gluconolactonase/LRE family protein [Puteibacter caeruleilacunae]|nr:SMP-30/gluconolactonase/LRE family protein [Puteibacter caeruleilacunae]
MMKVELIVEANNILGEGPLWDERNKEFVWVDIEKGLLQFFCVEDNGLEVVVLKEKISAVVLTSVAGTYLLALKRGLTLYDRIKGSFKKIVDPEKDIPNNRFNDGKCDSMGRFWIGSMDMDVKKYAGNLYCLNNDSQIDLRLSGLTISNGMAWSLDNQQMYFIDTDTYKVMCYDYDETSGAIVHPVEAVCVSKEHGAPDGMCIDSEGMLWIAHWGGANVSRWNPNSGELLEKVDIPAPLVTSCCFGGKDLTELYVTTASQGLTEDELKRYPLSGSVFKIKTSIKGAPVHRFHLNGLKE